MKHPRQGLGSYASMKGLIARSYFCSSFDSCRACKLLAIGVSLASGRIQVSKQEIEFKPVI